MALLNASLIQDLHYSDVEFYVAAERKDLEAIDVKEI
ncbi:MAG: hypothetical protein ACJA14_000871 [Ilumatobacter sp.]